MLRPIAVAATAILTLSACPATSGGPPVRSASSASPSSAVRRDCERLPELARRIRRGYVRGASPDINLIPRVPNYIGTATSPVHSGPWDYLARVPLLIYGPGVVKAGPYDDRVTMADLAPTTAALVGSERFRAPDGRVLREALKRPVRAPRLVVTMVWDGGGWNVLDRHEQSHPFFDSLSRRSATFANMEIGSSPSVTPPIHATLSTGAFPRRHGIPALRIRKKSEYVDPFFGLDPSNMRRPTVADVYDRETNNRAVTGMLAAVNWHLAMIGQGAGIRGGDRDPVVLFDDAGEAFGNPALYSVPDIDRPGALKRTAEGLDAADGSRDGHWRGHRLSDPQVRYSTPAHVQYQQMLLERFIASEEFGQDNVPDLLYVNFKPSDDAGHAWGMNSTETALTLEAQDNALDRLVTYLDRKVGSKRWVLFLTADHGQTPYPRESGGWAIAGGELTRDANASLDNTDDDVDLVDQVSSPGAYLNRSQLKANDLTKSEVARWMAGYTVSQNVKEGEEIPARFEGREAEWLFDATLVGDGPALSKACL